jgi:hypothetical protein
VQRRVNALIIFESRNEIFKGFIHLADTRVSIFDFAFMGAAVLFCAQLF